MYKSNIEEFKETAKSWTIQYAGAEDKETVDPKVEQLMEFTMLDKEKCKLALQSCKGSLLQYSYFILSYHVIQIFFY